MCRPAHAATHMRPPRRRRRADGGARERSQEGVTGNLEPPPGPEGSRAAPLGGTDHGTLMARVHVEFARRGGLARAGAPRVHASDNWASCKGLDC